MIRHAVIPAAGFGTRFLPATKAQPKEMLPIVDKPTIQFVVEEAVASGITDILIITGRGKRAIEDHFDKSVELEEFLKKSGKNHLLSEIEKVSNLADIHFVRQKEQKGLGDAVLCAEKHVGDEPFALLLGDTIVESKIPCTKQLMEKHEKFNCSIVGVEEVEKRHISKYGVVKPKPLERDLYEIEGLVEKPHPDAAPSNLAIAGRYVLTPKIFEYLKNTLPGKNGEIQLTDALGMLLKTERILAYRFSGIRYDIGDKFDYAKAFSILAMQRSDIGPELKEELKKIINVK
ncbi:MAG: UTP--glucose-1-phosphate uridylyltransferase GalU [Candidatus Micrarchaeota archaeon]